MSPSWAAGHVDADAGDVELPAVVDAAQALLLIAAPEQGRAAMRAVAVQHADLAGGIAEGDQVLAEDAELNGRAVGVGQLLGRAHRQPEAAEQLAHRRAAIRLRH